MPYVPRHVGERRLTPVALPHQVVVPDSPGRAARPAPETREPDLATEARAMFGYIVRRLMSAFLVVVLTSMIVFAAVLQGPQQPGPAAVRPERQVHPREAGAADRAAGLQRTRWSSSTSSTSAGLFHDREISFGADVPLRRALPRHLLPDPRRGHQRAARRSSRRPSPSRSAAPTIYLTLGVLLGTIAARKRGTAVDRRVGGVQRLRLGDPLLRDRPDGVDLRLAAVAADRGHLLPSRSPRTRWRGRPAWRCPGRSSDSPTPRRTRGTRAAR